MYRTTEEIDDSPSHRAVDWGSRVALAPAERGKFRFGWIGHAENFYSVAPRPLAPMIS